MAVDGSHDKFRVEAPALLTEPAAESALSVEFAKLKRELLDELSLSRAADGDDDGSDAPIPGRSRGARRRRRKANSGMMDLIACRLTTSAPQPVGYYQPRFTGSGFTGSQRCRFTERGGSIRSGARPACARGATKVLRSVPGPGVAATDSPHAGCAGLCWIES